MPSPFLPTFATVNGCASVQPAQPMRAESTRIRTCWPARQPALRPRTSTRVSPSAGQTGVSVAVQMRVFASRRSASPAQMRPAART